MSSAQENRGGERVGEPAAMDTTEDVRSPLEVLNVVREPAIATKGNRGRRAQRGDLPEKLLKMSTKLSPGDSEGRDVQVAAGILQEPGKHISAAVSDENSTPRVTSCASSKRRRARPLSLVARGLQAAVHGREQSMNRDPDLRDGSQSVYAGDNCVPGPSSSTTVVYRQPDAGCHSIDQTVVKIKQEGSKHSFAAADIDWSSPRDIGCASPSIVALGEQAPVHEAYQRPASKRPADAIAIRNPRSADATFRVSDVMVHEPSSSNSVLGQHIGLGLLRNDESQAAQPQPPRVSPPPPLPVLRAFTPPPPRAVSPPLPRAVTPPPPQPLRAASPQAQQPPEANRVFIAHLEPNKIAARVDGRVCSKTTLRQRSRETSVFNFVLQDETGKINATAWDAVAARIYESVKVGDCFTVTMAKVKAVSPASQQYRVTDHPCELTLTKWTEVINLPDNTLPPLASELLSLMDLRGKECNAVVDLLAVVFDVGTTQLISCHDGKTRKKRNVTLTDASRAMVTLGLWPDFTDVLNDREGEAVKFQNLQIREYNNKLMLSSTTNTIISTDVEDEAVTDLQRWFREHGFESDYEELEMAL